MAVKAWSSYGDVLLLLLVLPTLPFGFLGCLCQVFLLRCQKVRLELDHLNSLWVEDHRRLGGIPVIQCWRALSIWMENLIFAVGRGLLTQGQSMRGGNLLRKANQLHTGARSCRRRRSSQVAHFHKSSSLMFAGTQVGPASVILSCQVWPSTSITERGDTVRSTEEDPLQSKHFENFPRARYNPKKPIVGRSPGPPLASASWNHHVE